MIQKSFVFPTFCQNKDQKVTFAVEVIEKQRKENKLLREDTFKARGAQIGGEKELEEWREKYIKSQEENQKLRREIGRLKREKGKLEQEVERLTKTNSRYRVSLFDSGNYKSQTDEEKKEKGGQLNHPDTNREGQVDFPGYENYPRKRIYAKNCGKCGNHLERVNAIAQKLLLDIVVKPEIVQLIIESERQWCKSCTEEVNARDPYSLPFSEYG